MKKIIVIGCPGSGKSTFSRALAAKTGIPLYHLDMLYLNADGTAVEKSVFLDRLAAALADDAWIIDGNYSSTVEMRLSLCDTVFFLDMPASVCLNGIKERRGRARPDMPWIETKEDEAFTEFVLRFEEAERPKLLSLFEKYPEKTVITLKTHAEADAFLNNLA